MDCPPTSTSTLDFDELSQILQQPLIYPVNQLQNINPDNQQQNLSGRRDNLIHHNSQQIARSDNIAQETACGAIPSSDLQIQTASVPNSYNLDLMVPSVPMAGPQGAGPNFLGPSPFFQGPPATGVSTFLTTSVQNPRFQVPLPNSHLDGQFDNQTMRLMPQQLSHLEAPCTSGTQCEDTAQASDPGKVAELSPDLDLSPPSLTFDVGSHLESLIGGQPSVSTSNADALPPCGQLFNPGEMLRGAGPQGVPGPTGPYACQVPPQFPLASHAVLSSVSGGTNLAHPHQQDVSRPTQPRKRGKKTPIPEECKDEEYFEKRKRNNEAAKRSRDQCKRREEENAARLRHLKAEYEQMSDYRSYLIQKALIMDAICNRLNRQPLAGAGNVDCQFLAGAENINRQHLARVESVDRQLLAGSENVDRQLLAGSENVDRQLLAGVENVDRQHLAGAENVDRQPLARVDNINRQLLAGADNINRQHLAGVENVDRQPLARVDNINRQHLAGFENVDRQPLAGAGNVDRQPLAGVENVDRQPLAGVENVDRQPLAGVENVDRQPLAGVENVDRQPLAGVENVDRQLLSRGRKSRPA